MIPNGNQMQGYFYYNPGMMGVTIGLNNMIFNWHCYVNDKSYVYNYDDFVNLRLIMKNSSIQYTNI